MPACRLPGMLKSGHNHMTSPISYFVYDVLGFEDEGKRKKKKLSCTGSQLKFLPGRTLLCQPNSISE